MVVSNRTSTFLNPSIHAFVLSIFHLSLYISSSKSLSSVGCPPFLLLGHTLGMIPWGAKCNPVVVAVKTRVKVAEKAVRENTGVLELLRNLVHPVLYLIEVCMVSCLKVGHSQRNALVISEEKRVCCHAFLASLILDAFSSPQDWCMGAVHVGKRQVKGCLVLIDYMGVCLPPLILDTPFPGMSEHRVPRRRLSAEEVTQREKSPLASALELVEDGVDDLRKIEFRGIASFCNRKIGHNPNFYCIFVEDGVFWHGYGILKSGNYNKVRTLRSAPYFKFFIADLTYRNKSKQLQ